MSGIRAAAALAFTLLLLAGCGMYGSLYLEETPAPAAAEPAPAAPSADETPDEDEDENPDDAAGPQ